MRHVPRTSWLKHCSPLEKRLATQRHRDRVAGITKGAPSDSAGAITAVAIAAFAVTTIAITTVAVAAIRAIAKANHLVSDDDRMKDGVKLLVLRVLKKCSSAGSCSNRF